MGFILNKKEMSEEDIKYNFITPALIKSDWQDKITMETAVKWTDGKINLKGNIVNRDKPKKADYILYINKNNPIAIVEAKDNNHSSSDGLQQAMDYAIRLDLPFAYSSNGDEFYEHDFLTGIERVVPIDKFPTYDELCERYKREYDKGFGITENELKVINEPYYTSQTTHEPRYYQRIAVNRTLEAIVKGQQRLLLVMATGTGKTYTAFQIVYRLLKSGFKKKILYLADRNNLVDQSIQQDFAPLEKVIHKINFAKDDFSTITSYQVYFSLYQQLSGDEEVENGDGESDIVSKLSALFKPNYFNLIIVDECHRGSAKKDSNWRKVLEYFTTATQLGMTATPKETKYVSNIDYFGEPIYSYSLKDGIEDGFLAPFKVIGVKTNIGDGWRPKKGQLDINGNVIEDRIYNNTDYDYNITILDRINEVAKEITNYLKKTDRMAKTIVFCATEEHAERMRVALVNLNSDMVKVNPDYIVRITGSDKIGKSKIKYFISATEKYPVIATTSKLLSTGADCKMVKLIVIDQNINSMTEFKQILGRGTRLREKEGKTNFVLMDFRGVSRLFADPDWDGEPDGGEYDPPVGSDGKNPINPPKPPKTPPGNKNVKPIVDASGCTVKIINKTVSIYDTNGKLLRQEDIIDYTKASINGEYASLSDFINKWSNEEKKEKIQEILKDKGIDLDMLKIDQGMQDVDDFDFICHIAYDQKPLTRKERADGVRKKDFLSKYSGIAREVIDILIDSYIENGIYEVENTNILTLDKFRKYGKPAKIVECFGGANGYREAIKLLEKELYKVA